MDDDVVCPECNESIRLSTASRLQALRLGVAIVCPACGFEWIHTTAEPCEGESAGEGE